MEELILEKDSHYDSAFLMLISGEVKKTAGVRDANVAMGAPMNLDLLRARSFSGDAPQEAALNDLIIAVDCDGADSAKAAVAAAKQALMHKSKAAAGAGVRVAPTTLAAAPRRSGDAATRGATAKRSRWARR